MLSVLLPGLCCYAMYRAARLWLRTPAGAIAAGGLFGLSSMVTWLAWYQLNLAAGVLFLPLALEAAVRLRRRPGPRQAVILGLVLAASLLTDQETAVLAGILVVLVLVPWLAARPRRDAVSGDPAGGRADPDQEAGGDGGAVAVALAVASPQIVAMVVQSRSGGASYPPHAVAVAYGKYSANLRWMFGVSPRAVGLGLTALKPVSYPSSERRPGAHRRDSRVRPGAVRAGGGRADRVAAAAQRLAAGAAVGRRRRAGAGIDAEDRHPRLRARRPDLARRAGLGGPALHLVRPHPRAGRLPRGRADHAARPRARGAAGRRRR